MYPALLGQLLQQDAPVYVLVAADAGYGELIFSEAGEEFVEDFICGTHIVQFAAPVLRDTT
jgi:hypothetical protein